MATISFEDGSRIELRRPANGPVTWFAMIHSDYLPPDLEPILRGTELSFYDSTAYLALERPDPETAVHDLLAVLNEIHSWPQPQIPQPH